MTRESEPTYTLKGKHLAESAKAVKFRVDDIVEDVNLSGVNLDSPKIEWFPFSQISRMVKVPPPNYTENAPDAEEEKDIIVVKRWILQQKGFIS